MDSGSPNFKQNLAKSAASENQGGEPSPTKTLSNSIRF